MGIGITWVAGAVRGRLLADRRLGRSGARDLARSPTLPDALRGLEGGPYGHDVRREMNLAEAQRGVAAAALWHIRVLAGWLPPGGGDRLAAIAAWWEVLNIEDHLAALDGRRIPEPFALGSLATAWPRVAGTRTPAELRAALSGSPWGDPGGETPERVAVGLRLAWGRRLAEQVEWAARWADGWVALVVARDLFSGSSLLVGDEASRVRALGWEWREASSLAEFARRIPRSASWVLEGVSRRDDLWRAEARWWREVEADSLQGLHAFRPGPGMVVAVAGVLLADAWRVQAALEMAARGGVPMDVFDAVA